VFRALVGDRAPVPLEGKQVRDIRLKVLRPYFCDILDGDVRAEFESGIRALRSAGARIGDTGLAHASAISAIYSFIQNPEAAAYHARTLETMADRYTGPVRLRIEQGRYILGEDHVRALKGREVLRREVDEALTDADALILPTLPIPSPLLGASSVSIDGVEQPIRGLMLRLTQVFDISGHPAIAIPWGHTSQGLPCSLQFVGRRGQTKQLVEVARTCEGTLGRSAALL
jgi:aspartyl-tRNA(Asn)/glutamyl-tRNA(Gln) amidotransferase subunit A